MYGPLIEKDNLHIDQQQFLVLNFDCKHEKTIFVINDCKAYEIISY